ncbi:WhiB family transcriptional regulator [Nonomuraea lactucae]|uniref:WhiB family transcriptional regulator n=1 Tax=Nonomuraea lactucae TaxID=2249762 RepID=UPI000DE4F500|nr:WhiB family transcriptional regulator [Nonomuraea lactucae]
MVRSDLPIHPARMSLAEIETTWGGDGDPPLPECTYDPELHTGPRALIETSAEHAAREAVAREVCATCPASEVCAQYARKVRPTFGIWAGLTAAEIDTYAQMVELSEAMRARAARHLPGLEVA